MAEDSVSPSVREAAYSDAKFVGSFLSDAKQVVSEAQLLQDEALPFIENLILQITTGCLPRHEARAALAAKFSGTPAIAPKRSMKELIDILRRAIPIDAQAQRTAAALEAQSQPSAEVLVQLLRGATAAASTISTSRGAAGVAAGASESADRPSPSCLQDRILSALAEFAKPPLYMDGLLQATYRAEHQLSCSAISKLESGLPPPSSERAIFLAAATLARRGDQRGARHGCVLIEDGGATGSGAHDKGMINTSSADESHQEGACSSPSELTKVGGFLVVGVGWNHQTFEQRSRVHRTRVLHAEAHAIADAIRRHGERAAFDALERCTAWIVELRDDAAYDDAPPCRKCGALLQAVGVPRAVHSTRTGEIKRLTLPRAKPEMLSLPMACRPLSYACDALGVQCDRLERALLDSADAEGRRDDD